MSAKDAAHLWGISQRRVAVLCAEDRIPNVTMIGNMWLIPKTAKKPIDGRSSKDNCTKSLKPFVKWAGGKSQLISEISSKYSSELGKSIDKYAEPFVGGGAILLDILSKYQLSKAYISDINSELINTYICVRDNVDELIQRLYAFENAFLPLDTEYRKVLFYSNRARFNELAINKIYNTEAAALFIFLNKTCFNGLYRVNKTGLYNVPMGSYINPTICDEENLTAVSEALSNVEIVCADYRESASFIDDKTFVYFDPPYRPLNTTSSFTSYNEETFDDKSQIELANYVQKLAKRGAHIVLSNSDPKNTDPNDDFFDFLYAKQSIERIQASRMINSNGNSRGKISELLICN